MKPMNFFKSAENPSEQLPEKLLNRLKQINPNTLPRQCAIAATEAAKVLLDAEYKPQVLLPDVNAYFPYSDHGIIIRKIERDISKKTFYFESKRALLDNLLGLSDDVVMFFTNDEVDHCCNLYKTASGQLWLIDTDRQLYIQLNSEHDFVQYVSGFKDDSSKILSGKYDYFNMDFLDDFDESRNYSVLACVVDDELLKMNYQQVIEENNKVAFKN